MKAFYTTALKKSTLEMSVELTFIELLVLVRAFLQDIMLSLTNISKSALISEMCPQVITYKVLRNLSGYIEWSDNESFYYCTMYSEVLQKLAESKNLNITLSCLQIDRLRKKNYGSILSVKDIQNHEQIATKEYLGHRSKGYNWKLVNLASWATFEENRQV